MDETALQSAANDTSRPDWQSTRLAELVLHLTGCSPDEARTAVDAPPARRLSNDEALETVARAIVRIRS